MDLRRFFLPMRKEAELEETESSCGGRRRALEVWSEERKLWGEHLDSDADLGCRMEFNSQFAVEMRQEEGVHASIADLQFDAQGCLLAVANNRGNVRILDFDRFLNHVQNRDLHFKHSVQIDLNAGVSHCRWNPMNQNQIAISERGDTSICIYDLAKSSTKPCLTLYSQLPSEHRQFLSSSFSSICFAEFNAAPSQNIIFAGNMGGELHQFDLRSKPLSVAAFGRNSGTRFKCIMPLKTKSSQSGAQGSKEIRSLQVSRDGNCLYSLNASGKFYSWDIRFGLNPLSSYQLSGPVYDAILINDLSMLVQCSQDRHLTFDVQTFETNKIEVGNHLELRKIHNSIAQKSNIAHSIQQDLIGLHYDDLSVIIGKIHPSGRIDKDYLLRLKSDNQDFVTDSPEQTSEETENLKDSEAFSSMIIHPNLPFGFCGTNKNRIIPFGIFAH